MSVSELPQLPAFLSDFSTAFVGPVAHQCLGGQNARTQPEILVHATLDEILSAGSELVADESEIGGIHLDGWLIQAAPEGVEPMLQARLCSLASIGVRPDGSIIDPHNGVSDLKSNRIEVVGGGFEQAPENLLEVPALVSEFGWAVDGQMIEAMRAAADRFFRVPRPQIRHLMTRLLVGRHAGDGLRLLRKTGVLPYVLPEVSALVDFHRSSRHHHKDVWAHTCTVVDQAVPQPIIRWAALLHDIGKVHTRSYSGRSKVHFLRHDDVGAVMFEGIAHRLKFDVDDAERIRVLIQHHLRPGLYTSNWSDAAVRRFAGEMDVFLGDLLHLARADVTSKIPGRRKEAIENLHELKTRIDEVVAEAQRRQPCVPRGLGSRIISDLGIIPGPKVGVLRKVCEEAVRDGRLESEPEMNACIEFLRRHLAA